MDLKSILFVATGIVLIKKPELLWEISHLLGNKNESTKNSTTAIICVIGIILFIYGLLPLARSVFGI